MATEITQALLKALEAGNYNAAPSTLVQGSALQIEDLSPVMHNVTFDDSHIKLQKMIKVDSCKSLLAQFNRQLSYGEFGGSAQIEGAVGQEETSDFVRITVPMAFYSHVRRVSIVANMVDTSDGVKAEERAASDAAKKLAGDIEFDLFRGKADFSNAGVFDGAYKAQGAIPNMLGLDVQIRQSDFESNSQDKMFGEYGSDDTVVISGGGTLTQEMIEDACTRSAMNMGNADKLVVDPKVMSAYNKLAYGMQRINLAGGPQGGNGAEFKKQWTSNGVVDIEASRFLSGKTRPAFARANSPSAPTIATGVAGGTSAMTAGTYIYYVTQCNELGESVKSATASQAVAAGDDVSVTITKVGSLVRYYNVYRTAAGGAAATAKFIGRIADSGAATTVFHDLGNAKPGFVTGFLVQGDTMGLKELSPYSRVKLAVSDLSTPEAHLRFCSLAVFSPRKNVLISNLVGSL